MPKRCPNDAKNDATNDAKNDATMPRRCQNDAKKMASWQQFLCPKDTHTKKSENCACALSFSLIQMLPDAAQPDVAQLAAQLSRRFFASTCCSPRSGCPLLRPPAVCFTSALPALRPLTQQEVPGTHCKCANANSNEHNYHRHVHFV